MFEQPVLLWGGAFALVPVLIHLLLRPRPRRLRFPALVLMQRTIATGQRANRLRNLALLCLRAGLLGLAAALLAAPSCRGSTAVASRDPVACVLITDDSLSTHYRPHYADTATLLDAIRAQARALPAEIGSQTAEPLFLLLEPGSEPLAAWTASIGAINDALDKRTPRREHAVPLGAAFAQASAALRAVPDRRGRIYVLTDGTTGAWRDVYPSQLGGLTGIPIEVRVPELAPRGNLGLLAAIPPAGRTPETARVPVRVTIEAAGVAGTCWIEARHDGVALSRAGPFDVPANARREVRIWLPPRAAGPHAATIHLEPDDLLSADQRRFVVWETAPRPIVWMVMPRVLTAGREAVEHAAPGAAEDLTVLLLRNLIAPGGLPPEQQRVRLEEVTDDALDARITAAVTMAERPAVVIVFPNVVLSDAARDEILNWLDAGSVAILMPSSRTDESGGPPRPEGRGPGEAVQEGDPEWPALRPMLSESYPTLERLPASVGLHWAGAQADGVAAADAGTTAARVDRRVRFSRLVPQARVLATYADGVPAWIERSAGKGRLVAWTTSPDPAWSDLGIRAAGFLTWLHGIIDAAQGPPTAIRAFIAGEPSRHSFPVLPRDGLVQVTRSHLDEPPVWIRLRDGEPTTPWPTARAGLYAARAADARDSVAWYAVNWPAEEFDLRPVDEDSLRTQLGADAVRLVAGRSGNGDARRGWLGGSGDAKLWLSGALLAVFFAEWLLASAARRGAKQEPAPRTVA